MAIREGQDIFVTGIRVLDRKQRALKVSVCEHRCMLIVNLLP